MMAGDSGRPGGLSSLRDEAASASSPKASIPDAEALGAAMLAVWEQADRNHKNHSATGSNADDIRFFTLGLAGEGGEALEAAMLVAMKTGKVADKVKKLWRDDASSLGAAQAECADVFAYNIMLAKALGLSAFDLIDVVAFKQEKFVEKMKAKALATEAGTAKTEGLCPKMPSLSLHKGEHP